MQEQTERQECLKNSLGEMFSPGFLADLRKDIRAKMKPSKAILQAVKQTNEINQQLKKQNQNLKVQLQSLREENKMLIQMVDSYREEQLMHSSFSESKLETAYDNQAKMSATISHLSKELQNLQGQLSIFKGIFNRRDKNSLHRVSQSRELIPRQITSMVLNQPKNQQNQLRRLLKDENTVEQSELEKYFNLHIDIDIDCTSNQNVYQELFPVMTYDEFEDQQLETEIDAEVQDDRL